MQHLSRIILIVMLLAGLILIIVGPSSEVSLPADRQGDTVIQYWEKWSGSESVSMQQVVDGFNDTVGREKHIYVQYLSMTNITQKTLAASAAGVPPDVAGLWHNVLAQFASLGALQPLDDVAAEYQGYKIDASLYKSVYWNSCHYNGHLYAMVSTPGAVALFYNTKIFRENADKLRAAGLDPDRAPRTLQELDKYAQTLDVWETGADGKKELVRAGYLPLEPGWYVTSTPIWFGTDIWDPVTRHFIVTDPRVVSALRWIASYAQRLGKEEVERFGGSVKNFDTPQNPFMAGTVAMEQQGPWLANYIHRWNPKMDGQWAAVPFPSAVPGLNDVTFCPFDTLCIPSGSKHKAEAFEFIAYVNRQNVMEKLCSEHCKNSPLAKVSENFIKTHHNPYISVFEKLASSPNAYGPMDCPIGPEVGGDAQAMFQAVANLDVDPEKGAAELQDNVEAEWAAFLHSQKLRDKSEQ